ncbi:MAG: glycosyltransferase family 2 protein [Thiomicrospira sp.]
MNNYVVVIPAFNEAKTIVSLIEAVLKRCEKVIVVDDASTDETAMLLADLPVKLIRHNTNQGKASALKTGFSAAIESGAQAVITLDGDGQHNPDSIPHLLEAYITYPRSIIIGARLIGRERAPKRRRRANDFADFWVSWAASTPVKDSQSGFRVYPMSLFAQGFKSYPKSSGFVFESEILIEAANQGYQLVSVPIDSVYPKNNRPSHFRPIFDISQITWMVTKKLLAKGLNPLGLYTLLRNKPICVARQQPSVLKS